MNMIFFNGEGVFAASGLVPGSTMKNQAIEAVMTVNLLKEIELMRVFRRSGELSTHRPTLEEKHIDASIRIMPLQGQSTHDHIRSFLLLDFHARE